MPKTVDELMSTGLKYYGQARLDALSDTQLVEISQKLATGLANAEEQRKLPSARAEVIEYILKRKKQYQEKMKQSPLSREQAANTLAACARRRSNDAAVQNTAADAPEVTEATEATEVKQTVLSANSDALPDGENTKLIPSGEDGVALEITVQPYGVSSRVIKDRHAIHICSFNSLKLRTQKVGLQEHWLGLVATLATFDVVVVQEVPAEGGVKNVEDTRAYWLKRLLDHHSGDEWQIVLSEASGPGNLEVHAGLVRKPIKILDHCTHYKAADATLDHAPLVLKLHDERFQNEGDRTWVITSVHFPPKARSRERDAQIHRFFSTYETNSEFRLGTPLTEKGAKDAGVPTVHHVICGDYNAYVGIGYGLETRGFAPPLLGEHVSTSSGCQAYDNFVLSKYTANRFSIGTDVLELTMPAVQCEGKDGLSDHHPITVKLKDVATTKSKAAKAKSSAA
jgi:hypothetical protein